MANTQVNSSRITSLTKASVSLCGFRGFFMSDKNTQDSSMNTLNVSPSPKEVLNNYIAEDLPITIYAENQFQTTKPVSLAQLCQAISLLFEQQFKRGDALTTPQLSKDFLIAKLAPLEREVFCCLHLDNQHHVIAYEELFYGTIDGASVYPREVVKSCLKHNAAAVIFAHNHPSGIPDPSQSDKQITQRLQSALSTVDIRVLDHIIVGGSLTTSFADKGLL